MKIITKLIAIILLIGAFSPSPVQAQTPIKETVSLPEEFSKLSGIWQFKKLVSNGKEYTSEFQKGYVDGKPMIVEFKANGTLIYQDSYMELYNLERAEWVYLYEDERKENEPEINLYMKRYMNDGQKASEKYTLIKVTDEILVYGNKMMELEMTFERVKETNISKQKLTTSLKAEPVSIVKTDMKTQLLREWEFHEITLTTPKDGYLMRISERETEIMNLLVANYTFNKDGSITLDPNYMEKQGVKKATWKMDEPNDLTITYFLTPEKQKEAEYSNDYEKVSYKIDFITTNELTISLSDMFFVNLLSK